MKFVQRSSNTCIMLLVWLTLILQILPPVVLISSPSELTREVGEDVVFMYNGTEFSEAMWGVRKDAKDISPSLVRILNPGGDNVVPIAELNSTRYAGRVSFVGDLTKGQAWFKITNLNINDTNEYRAKMYEKGGSQYEYKEVKLTVVQPAAR